MNTKDSNSRQGLGLLIILIFIALYGVYYYYNSQQDKKLANQVYNQLELINEQLDSLNITAGLITTQKQLNDQIITEIGQITPENYAQEHTTLEKLVQQINYNPVTQQKFESAITILSSMDNNLKELKRNLKLLKIAERELKYQHNQEVSKFNQQITAITAQVSSIKDEISHIHADQLQELELAKLKFISKKLTETAHSLHAAFYTSLVDDVLDTVISDANSESK